MKSEKMLLAVAASALLTSASFAELPVGDVAWLNSQIQNAKSGSEIVIPRGEYALTKQLQLLVDNVILRGETGNAADVVLRGDGTFRCLLTQKKGSMFRDLTVRNGSAANGGGGINIEGGVVSNCVVEGCSSGSGTAGGGGMRLIGSSAYDCIVRNNSCVIKGGGGIDANGACEICRCTLENNVSQSEANFTVGGGGIQMSSAGVIRDCTFLSNTATYGGAIHGYPSLVEGCHFATNSAREGAVALLYKNTTPVPETLFRACVAVTNEAQRGIFCTREGEKYRLDGCTFVSNVVKGLDTTTAAYIGAGAFFDKDNINNADRSILSISNCLFKGHQILKDNYYANFFHHYERPKNVYGTTFEDNAVTKSISEILPVDKDGLVENCKFICNRHLGNNLFTVLRVCGTGVQIRSCLFETNTVGQGLGTAIGVAYKSNAPDQDLAVTIDNCTFAHNVQRSTMTGTYGGAVYLAPGSLVRNCLFFDNHDKTTRPVYTAKDMTTVTPGENFFHCCDANATHQLGTDNDCFCCDPTPAAVGLGSDDPVAAHDYSLAKNSPLVDKGMSLSWIVPDVTLDVSLERKHYRKIGDGVDIGAWEYRPAPGLLLLVR